MRDLKRPNASMPAWRQLAEIGLKVFTPMRWRLVNTPRGRQRRELPVIPDLLFVNDTRAALDPVVDAIPTLQYRFLRGAPSMTPMTVSDRQMDSFMTAVTAADSPVYYTPGELTEDHLGKRVLITDGPMAGVEGRLLKQRGSRIRRLVVEVDSLLVASVEVCPAFIRLLD